MEIFQANLINQKPRVLIVDNDPRARVSYQALLMYWGYEPILAMGEGKSLFNDALLMAKRTRCALGLIDLRLLDDFNEEDTSGLKLAREIGPVKSIILSGYSNQKILREIIDNYKDVNFISKSDSPETIRQVLDTEARKVSAEKRGLQFSNINVLNQITHTALGSLTSEYPDQIADVFAQLFPKALNLKLEKLDSRPFPSRISTVPRPQSVVLKVYEEDLEPVIVKLARAKKIQIEADRYYEFISGRVTRGFTAHLERHAILWDIGGALYSYVGDFDVQTFSRYYEEKPIEDIEEALRSFFTVSWFKHYAKAHDQQNVSLFDLYNNVWGDWYEKRVKKFTPTSNLIANGIHENLGLPEPIEWFKDKISENREKDLSRVRETRIAVTHGDLHGDNLLIDSKKNAWVIDFERSGEGHILQDFIELESDIINRLEAHNDNLLSYYRLCVIVAKQTMIQQLEKSEMEFSDLRIHKALQTISIIRSLANQCTGLADAREYLLGLLFNTIFRATIAYNEHDNERQNRALLLASIFCHRLEHWDDPWPPEEWKSLLRLKED
jgi:thiamine kinase-like enzyme/CheY-like chemotaxis protein